MSSDVIRDAVIRIRYEAQTTNLGGPNLSQTVQAHEQVAKATRQVRSATEDAARAHEDFGRRSFEGMAHAGEGVLRLSRGLALLGTSGEKDTSKLLENLLKIEAAVDIAKGGAKLAKSASQFGALGVVVAGVGVVAAAGAATWSHYHAEVEKTEAALKKMVESQKAASQAEAALQQERDQIKSRGQAGQTDAEFDPAKRHLAQNAEFADRRAKMKERKELGANTEAAIAKAETEARQAESDAISSERRNASGGDMNDTSKGWLDTPENYKKKAEAKKAAAAELRQQRKSQLELDVGDAERQKELIGTRHSDQIDDIHKREESKITQMREAEANETPVQKARREKADTVSELQREKFKGAMGGMNMMGGVMGGMAMNVAQNATPQQKREAGTHFGASKEVDKANEEATNLMKNITGMLTGLNDELSRLKKDMQAGQVQ